MRCNSLEGPSAGAHSRRFSHYSGLFFDEFDRQSAWIREAATVQLPPLDGVREILLTGETRRHPEARGIESAFAALEAEVGGRRAVTASQAAPGPWTLRIPLNGADPVHLRLRIRGVGLTNFLAWAGRITGFGPLQRFRRQNKNRQLRIRTVATEDGQVVFDFAQRDAPYSTAFARRHARLGVNIVGFLTADLGLGESARCMVRAVDAAGIPAALVPLKLNCRNRLGDQTYAARLQEANPHGVNVIHLDPPASRDIDHHHGRAFRAGKYNIGFFAWELPDFPDAWIPSFDFYDEIWCPSHFTTAAVAMKSPLPVIAMPHAISFSRPSDDVSEIRARLGLPRDAFLFLALFDLNSYSARKNPRGAIEAFRHSGLAGRSAVLVVKVQNVAGNEADFAALQSNVQDIPGTILLTQTLSRTETYALEAACDCFVSLHRSEGFGLAVAECMYLGKPVIATDWSATAEYVTPENGCPVRMRLAALEENHGPYSRGSSWAEPDIAHAAEHMRTLIADRKLASELGKQAVETIESRFSPAAIGTRYRRRLECIAAF